MLAIRILLILGIAVLTGACSESLREAQTSDTQEIIDNLVMVGFRIDDIAVVSGLVYVGRDAEVSLLASREMLKADDGSHEEYRTHNLVGNGITRICINAETFTELLNDALDLAIENFNQQGLRFTMARAPSTSCSFTINAVIQPGLNGGVAGFPSGGLPFGTITIGDAITSSDVDLLEHVITHELGHTIGLRHSDFYNRSISCGSGGSEGDFGVGAIFIPGTSPIALPGGSVMNSCFRSTETGELGNTDMFALKVLYAATCDDSVCHQICTSSGSCEGFCSNNVCTCRFRKPNCP